MTGFTRTTLSHTYSTHGFPTHSTYTYRTYNSLSPSLVHSFAIVQFGLHSFQLSTLTLCFQLWPLATSSSLRTLRTVDFTLGCCTAASSLSMLAVPNFHTEECTETKGPPTHHWFWAAFLQQPSASTFSFHSCSQYMYSFCPH